MSDGGFKELPIAKSGPLTHSPGAQTPIIGIDLGTTNSLVAIVERRASGSEGTPVVLQTREGRNLLPSVVHFGADGEPTVGFAAREKRVSDPLRTIYSVKRLLGRGAADVADIKDKLGFNIDESSASNVRISVGTESYTPVEISAMILRELKAAAEEQLGRAVEDAVITVPAYFNDSQRQATRMAGRIAGLNVLRILNEPTAASLAYGLQYKRNGLIAVYDLGGGTFDVSILKLHDGIFEVLATNGDTQLGGDDMDNLISDWIESTVSSTGARSGTYPQAERLRIAERLKIQLSDKDTAVESGITLTRAQFDKIISPLLERTRGPVLNALKDAGLSPADITDVVLVGGPTRLPTLRDFVKGVFNREPNWSMHPDEVVALGAAIQGDILAGNNREFLLLDVVPLSLGLETFGGAMTKLIMRNTRIPTLAKESFTTYVDGQTKVAINVYQGERELVKDNRKLAEFVLSGIPPLPAGMARIEVTFLVDADGILNVAAQEVHSGVQASIEVKPTYGLTDSEVERMLLEGLEHAEEDKLAAALVDVRNDASKILTATEKALNEVEAQLPSEESQRVHALIDELKAKMNTNDVAAIKAAHSALNKGTEGLAEILMNHSLRTGLKNKQVKEVFRK